MNSQILIEGILTQANANPEKVVVKDSKKLWTWRSLIARANSYRKAIKDSEELADEREFALPILVDRSGETVAAILGAIMSGNAFSPLSQNQPQSRLSKVLKTLDARRIMLTDHQIVGPTSLHKISASKGSIGNDVFELSAYNSKSDIAYVLFTSGSTGQPKGVVANYSNINNTMRWSADILQWRKSDVIGNCTNFFFDISMFDIFTLFYFGVPMAIFSEPSTPIKVLDQITDFKISSIFGVPTFFSQIHRQGLIDDKRCETIRRIISGGDFFPPTHILSWFSKKPNVEIYNVWGPTETSIVNTMHKIVTTDLPLLQSGRSPSVGKAHPRMQFILIDENNQVITDPNVAGEICMLGDCVTVGYLGDQEKTDKAYFNFNGTRAFHTQDLGYTDENDNLFIIGRTGTTVKVSGYRINLVEIESVASTLVNIHLACCCVVETKSQNPELVLVLEQINKNLDEDIYVIKKALRRLLPNYMVPKRIIWTDALPKNPNGKVDRNLTSQFCEEYVRSR
jgi:acyl-coenzyme A synthetase/AMP-(fatty) acid ligase